jgi:hypothetical protein
MPFCLQMHLGDDDSGGPNSKEALDPEPLRSWASYQFGLLWSVMCTVSFRQMMDSILICAPHGRSP